MSAVTYPAVLLVTQWEKQKGVLAKPTGIGDGLKALKRLHEAVDWALLDSDKLKTVDELQERSTLLAAEVKRKIRALSDQAETVATLARKSEAEFKKQAQNPKEAQAAAAAVAKAATSFGEDVTQAAEAAQDELTARLAKARSEADDKAAKAPAELPGQQVVRAKVISGLKAVRANHADAKPTLFMLCVGRVGCTVYLSHTVGASHKALLNGLLPGDSSFKYVQGQCIWEKKAYTFVSEDMPSGLARRLQRGLLNLTGLQLKVRTRKPTGEAEETEDGDDIEDEATPPPLKPTAPLPTPVSSTGAPAADDAKAFNVRLAALVPRAKLLLSSGDEAGTAVKLKLSEAGVLAKKDLKRAHLLLDDAESLLASPKSGPSSQAAWQALKTSWQQASARVDAQLLKLQQALKADEDEVLRAVGEYGLNGVTGDYKVPLQAAMHELDSATGEARRKAIAKVYQAVVNFRKHIESDEGVAVCDDNPYDIPVGIRIQLGGVLAKMVPALAAMLK